MKKSKILIFLAIIIAVAVFACGCAAGTVYNNDKTNFQPEYIEWGNEYNEIDENSFVDVTESNNKSYISLTTNTASYTDLRRQILEGRPVDKDAVKIEEMINYFRYDYELPSEDKPLSMNGIVMDTPWNLESKLLMVGMRAEDVVADDKTNNIVLLIDVSGSMSGNDRLPLAVEGLILMVDEMTENDTVSIVTYSGKVATILDGANGTQKELIKQKLCSLTARGSTAGGSAIEQAYEIAAKYKDNHDNSTILMITDGDFNVGVTSVAHLEDMVLSNKLLGISFSAAGVGYGNMKDTKLQAVADAGGGRVGYLNSIDDANKFLVEELGALINIVARDAKAEITFNPEVVSKFRMIGYENRQLTEDEWQDEDTNAGAIGSGLMVTAVYEIILTENEGDFATVTLKYKTPDLSQNKTDSFTLSQHHTLASEEPLTSKIKTQDCLFIASVIETALILRNSSFKGTASYQSAYDRLQTLTITETDEYKNGFKNLLSTLLTR